MATVMPVTKAVYLCDEVIEDNASQKVHLVGIFNAVRPPVPSQYPFRLGQLCVFTQLIGGIGELPVHIEIIDAQTEEVIYAFPMSLLRFATRQTTVSACFRIRNCVLATSGVYFVEMYSQDTFIDDRALFALDAEL